ncbi:levansucrase [Amaricoccus tamworthensis]|uniref:levansucrase n=1 Tax=Amaricoccus tamworthensis TaxID=57002 RepID=UPI003C7ADE21
MGFALEDKWLWDSWYVQDGDLWHGFFLEAPKSIGDPEQRHWNVSYHHATSRDLTVWDSLGTCFAPAPTPAWDDLATWTGSVVRGDDGKWHLFYTGVARADNARRQHLGHAVSADLHNWERVGDGRMFDLAPPYEDYVEGRWHERACRDPHVIRDPDGDGWLMFFTARDGRVDDGMEAGAIGFATSPDLYEWTLQEPVFTGGFAELEVPQVFEAGGRWYCLFCVVARYWSPGTINMAGPAMTGTHCLIGESPRGPWRVAPAPLLDCAPFPKRYAARIVQTDAGMKLLGFNWFAEEGGPFLGEISDPVVVENSEDGLLRLALLAAEEK